MTLDQARAFFAHDVFASKQANVVIDAISPDKAVCSMQITPDHLNANNTVMGGAIFTLADLCFAAATNTGDFRTVSVESNITFLRAASAGSLHAESVPLKVGKSVCFYRVEITDDDGNLIAEVSFTGSRRAVVKA